MYIYIYLYIVHNCQFTYVIAVGTRGLFLDLSLDYHQTFQQEPFADVFNASGHRPKKIDFPDHVWYTCRHLGDLGMLDATLYLLQVPVAPRPFQAHFQKPINDTFRSEGQLCTNMVTHMQTGLQPLSCHHHSLLCPKSRLTHRPGSQQMPAQLLEPVGHP